ncbi:hypothetical protein [Cellulomonas endometrii]|uniref:hypothetical protein n=1 Tax=Cellulomonas endometrii TaxID=3036301 RepID=UPI0024AC83A6|nr:hypothetical protein [Cellulomonas endometrii]
MPAHAILGSVTLLLSVLSACTAIAYVAVVPARRALRWPLIVLAVASMALVVATGEAGEALLDAVEAVGSPSEVDMATVHAHRSGTVATAMFFLLATVLATVWGPLHPTKRRWSLGMRVAGTLTAIVAVAVLVSAAVVLVDALQSVGAGNPAWKVQ